jgi:hypothetical protein
MIITPDHHYPFFIHNTVKPKFLKAREGMLYHLTNIGAVRTPYNASIHTQPVQLPLCMLSSV